MSSPEATTHPRLDGPATMPVDATGWWEVERARWIRQRVAALTGPAALVADVGCGRGVMLADDALSDRIVVNVDSYRWSNWIASTRRAVRPRGRRRAPVPRRSI